MDQELQKILNKLFYDKKQRWYNFGAGIGLSIGFLLLLLAVQTLSDIKQIFSPSGGAEEHFIQLNKKINLFNSIGVSAAFSKSELKEIEQQPFVESIGVFVSNEFKAGAYSDLLGFYTELFFESIPDSFLDIEPFDFSWNEGQKLIPVVISRDYLALYNFGFAPSQGLPQLSAKSVKRLSIDVRLEGRGKRENFTGKVVGFTDRFNSILVPQNFLKWANAEFGNNKPKAPSRIIVQVTNPLSKELKNFITEKKYEISTGRMVGEKYIVFLRVAMVIAGILGIMILLLAMLVFLLSFRLLIFSNSSAIKRLFDVGFSPKMLKDFFRKKFLMTYGITVFSTFILFLLYRTFFVKIMDEQGFELSLFPKAFFTVIIILMLGLLAYASLVWIKKAITEIASR